MAQKDNNSASLARVSTGIGGLDEIMPGGWPAHHLYLVEGDPGTGKTTLALQFLMDGARLGERVLYVTLSESGLEMTGVAESHNWSLDQIDVFEFVPSEESLRPENEYSAFHPSDVEFQDTMQSILQKIEEVRPTRVVIDSLSEIRLLARESLRYRRQVLALKRFFQTRNCTVLMLDDRTSDSHDLQLHSIAHGVLVLERLQRDYGSERRRLRVAKLRGSIFREGFHDYTIETGGLRVFPRLVAKEHRPPARRGAASSGLAELDALWCGGVPWGSSTLITGPAGCGKSSIAMHYAFAAAARGERAELYHFDETLSPLIERSTALGMDIVPHMEAGRIRVRQLDPAEMCPGQFVLEVREAVEKRNARIIIIDSLNGLLNSMNEERQMVLQMHELCAYLNQQGVATFLVLAQAGLMGPQMSPPVDLSYLADNVLLLRYFEAFGRVKKALSVVKKRSGPHEETIRELRPRNGGVEIGEALSAFHGVLTGVPTYTGSLSTLAGARDDQPKR
jgi:circadian clock protein KaiC